MTFLDAIENKTKAGSPLAVLINDDCPSIGGIYNLDYGRAIVLTDDFRKSEAGGVPLGGYLLAAAGNQTDDGFVLDDEELVLLRVRGTAPLPNESDLVQTRLAVVRDATNRGKRFDEVTDVLTRNELQQSAFDCEVIGTYFTPEPGMRDDRLRGRHRQRRRLREVSGVPSLKARPVVAGVLPRDPRRRHAPTRHGSLLVHDRRARAAGINEAEVRVHVSDFISRKTAVFGMTRTGKSNTIKTLVTAVNRYASTRKEPIGQLIFDPQGEYANVNDQDKTGLKLLGDDDERPHLPDGGGQVGSADPPARHELLRPAPTSTRSPSSSTTR